MVPTPPRDRERQHPGAYSLGGRDLGLQFPSPSPIANAAAADAAATQAKYEPLFGMKERTVSSTSTTKDDAMLAGEVLKATESLSDDPELVTLLCVKAFEFGSRDTDGYKVALAAARGPRPGREGECPLVHRRWLGEVDAKIVQLHRDQYRREG